MVEPDFQNERELECAVVCVAEQCLKSDGEPIVVRGFGLDIAVFATLRGRPTVRLLEIKAFSTPHGRCGFGHGTGGNQVRLLWDDDSNAPRSQSGLRLLDQSVRWVIGHRGRPPGAPRFAFLDCSSVQNAASGGVKRGKYNNIRLSALSWITWDELELKIIAFLRSDRTQPT
jgi:hypothetical protein